MTDSDLVFPKLAVTRFSHDLAGVVSAVSNSLALLSEIGGADEETMKLATGNAEILMARLRFFRAAFGNDGPLTDAAAARTIFEDYLHSLENRSTVFTCDWQTDAELPIFMFRLMLLGGQLAAESLMRGGKITISAKAGEKKVCFEAEGKTVIIDKALESALSGSDENLTPKMVTAVFLKDCLKSQGWDFVLEQSEEKFKLTLTAKK